MRFTNDSIVRKLTALGFLLIACASAQDKPVTDLEGWSKATWGMTEADVLAAFGNEARRGPSTESVPDPLTIYVTSIDLGLPSRFTARFRFDKKTGGLFAVYLEPERFSMDDYAWFGALTSSLTSKYGSPSATVDNGSQFSEQRHTVWSLPKTKITVVLIGWKQRPAPPSITPILGLRYEQIRKDVLDKL